MNYSMGAFAELFGVSRERIRYYEKLGLLPAPPRAENGYRTYSQADTERLFFILMAKRHGFTLREIKTQLLPMIDETPECDPSRYLGIIPKKIAQVDRDILRLTRVKALLQDMGGALKAGQSDPCGALDRYIHQKPLDTEV